MEIKRAEDGSKRIAAGKIRYVKEHNYVTEHNHTVPDSVHTFLHFHRLFRHSSSAHPKWPFRISRTPADWNGDFSVTELYVPSDLLFGFF